MHIIISCLLDFFRVDVAVGDGAEDALNIGFCSSSVSVWCTTQNPSGDFLFVRLQVKSGGLYGGLEKLLSQIGSKANQSVQKVY